MEAPLRWEEPPLEAPWNLAYSTNPAVYTRGVAIAPNTPTSSGGAVESYSVEPRLPPGLRLDTFTGVITGTPTFVTATYNTVTASSSGGDTTVSLSIIIAPGAELYDPAMGTFTPTGNLATVRIGHTATLLLSGKVLIAGGWNWAHREDWHNLASAELFNPATGTFTPTGNLTTGRSRHTATLLPSGKVLITGNPYATTAELYDPATEMFTPVTPSAPESSTATLLLSGKVLITREYPEPSELYDPATGMFTPTGTLTAHRFGDYTATLLPSGKVLIAGYLASAELYDPDSGTFTPTGSLATVRTHHTATLLLSGKVLVAGGAPKGHQTNTVWVTAATELYDPAMGTFTPTGNLATARNRHTATLLPSGKVLIAGGYTGGTGFGAQPCGGETELYDPATGTFTLTGTLAAGRMEHTATLLPNGKVLIVGGRPWFFGGGATGLW